MLSRVILLLTYLLTLFYGNAQGAYQNEAVYIGSSSRFDHQFTQRLDYDKQTARCLDVTQSDRRVLTTDWNGIQLMGHYGNNSPSTC